MCSSNWVSHFTLFDAAKIKGSKVIVGTVPRGTRFTTLDGKERKLHEHDLMICDEEGGMCIAGVFGGIGSGVTNETTSIFLESAYFDPVSIRRTVRRHGLNTEASFRFERGIDPNAVVRALKRAILLMEELADAKVASNIVDLYNQKIPNHRIELKLEYMDRVIGEVIDRSLVRNILGWLDIKIVDEEEGCWVLDVPAYRVDVTRAADVVEEILRIYGYNNISDKGKMLMSTAQRGHPDLHRAEELVCEMLCSSGFHQMIANSLTSADHGEDKAYDLGEGTHAVRILNPPSSGQAVMRRSLLPGALEVISHNIKHQRCTLSLFEFGHAYFEDTKSFYREEEYLMLILTGPRSDEHWATGKTETSFFQLKSAVHKVLKRLGLDTDSSERIGRHPYYSEGIELQVRGKKIGFMGMVRSDLLRKANVDQVVYAAEMRWDLLKPMLVNTRMHFRELPKFPSARRDLALLVNKDVRFRDIRVAAEQAERKLLQKIELFDVYEGKQLPDKKKSYAVSFVMCHPNKTLTDKEVDKAMNKIQLAITKSTGAELRK